MTEVVFIESQAMKQRYRMSAIEVMKLVRAAPPGRTNSTNASSQDSASLHPGLFSMRPSRTIGAFDLLAGGKRLVVTMESVHAIALGDEIALNSFGNEWRKMFIWVHGQLQGLFL